MDLEMKQLKEELKVAKAEKEVVGKLLDKKYVELGGLLVLIQKMSKMPGYTSEGLGVALVMSLLGATPD